MLRDDQIEEILKLVDFRMSKGEIGNFFRNADHPKYVECGDQVLRNFLNGLVIYLRGTKENPRNPMETIAIHKKEAQQKPLKDKSSDKLKIKREDDSKKTVAPKKKFVPKKQVKKTPIVEKVAFKNGKKKRE